MKKALLIASLLAVITLAACGKKDESTGATPDTDVSTELSPTAIPQEPAANATVSNDTVSAATQASSVS
ncbi:hypothetical protein GKR41_00370 [Candidatus Vallotia lariciata]|nr:hypothetical protein GKR41_00370 [Candidatus Vallotia lariciata]